MIAIYRHMLRHGYRAVEHHPRQKFIFRKVLRGRFTESEVPPADRVANTVQFLTAAAESNGLERRCVATMLHEAASRHSNARFKRIDKSTVQFNDEFYRSIIHNINESLKLCL